MRDGKNPSGSQRMRCQACGRRCTPRPQARGYPDEVRGRAIRMCLEGVSFRQVARELGVNHQTVVNWVNSYVAHAKRGVLPVKRRLTGE